MATVADDFNRANGNLAGSTTSVGAQTWSVSGHSPAGTWAVTSNQAVCTSSSSTETYALVPCGADGTFGLTLVSGFPGLILRAASGGATFLLAYVNGLYSLSNALTSPVYTLIGGYTSSDFAAGDVMEVVASGTSIVVKKNGATVGTFTTSTYQSQTYAGLYAGATGYTVDGFTFTAVTWTGSSALSLSTSSPLLGPTAHALAGTAAVNVTTAASFAAVSAVLTGAATVAVGTVAATLTVGIRSWTADETQGCNVRVDTTAVLTVTPIPVPPPNTAAYTPVRRVSPTMPAPTLDSRGRPT